jgi:transposase-like protein
MIVETTVYTCRRCESSHLVKNGHNACGNPQYLCKDCGHRAVLVPKVRYPEAQKSLILDAYYERPGMRGIERIFGVSRQTLASWLKKG